MGVPRIWSPWWRWLADAKFCGRRCHGRCVAASAVKPDLDIIEDKPKPDVICPRVFRTSNAPRKPDAIRRRVLRKQHVKFCGRRCHGSCVAASAEKPNVDIDEDKPEPDVLASSVPLQEAGLLSRIVTVAPHSGASAKPSVWSRIGRLRALVGVIGPAVQRALVVPVPLQAPRAAVARVPLEVQVRVTKAVLGAGALDTVGGGDAGLSDRRRPGLRRIAAW